MKKYIPAAIILLAACGLRAQDQLYKSDNSKILVKILEVGPEEIKYKLYSNLTGPTYVETRKNVNLIIYENGKHDVLNAEQPVIPASPSAAGQTAVYVTVPPVPFDSSVYMKYRQNISINFLPFFNNEVGILFQREFYKSHFNIVIPLGFGVEKPNVTNSVYFEGGGTSYFIPDRKVFEVGFGINYYPSLRSSANYYIGPVFRYLQYEGLQSYRLNNKTLIVKDVTLSRYCMSITNGVVLRTKSRLTVNFFASIGFKNDVIDNPIVDPTSGFKIDPFSNPLSLYFWTGFNVGFSF